jgi:hypothetical protein
MDEKGCRRHEVDSLRFSIAQQKAQLTTAERSGDDISVVRIERALEWFERTNRLLFQAP